MSTFREGMLLALAENGIAPEDLGNFCLTKSAVLNSQLEMNIGNPLSLFGDAVGSAISLGVDLPVAAAVGIGGLAGAAGGYGIHALTKRDASSTVKDLKNKELVDELKLQSELIKKRLVRKRLLELKQRGH